LILDSNKALSNYPMNQVLYKNWASCLRNKMGFTK